MPNHVSLLLKSVPSGQKTASVEPALWSEQNQGGIMSPTVQVYSEATNEETCIVSRAIFTSISSALITDVFRISAVP